MTEAEEMIISQLRSIQAAVTRIEAAQHGCDMLLTDNLGSECRRPAGESVHGKWFCERHAAQVKEMMR